MKKSTFTPFLIFLLAAFIFSSCGKYPEGPAVSVIPKKNRVANTWNQDKVLYNDQETSNYDEDDEYIFTKDGEVTYKSVGNNSTSEYEGTWKFANDKEDIEYTIEYSYTVGNSTFTSTETTKATILKLKKDEFWVESTDEDGNTTEIHFVPAE